MKVLIEIDTLDIFDNTNSYREDNEIVEEMIDKLEDETLVNEVVKRGLEVDVWNNLSKKDQESLLTTYAEDYGYYKKEE